MKPPLAITEHIPKSQRGLNSRTTDVNLIDEPEVDMDGKAWCEWMAAAVFLHKGVRNYMLRWDASLESDVSQRNLSPMAVKGCASHVQPNGEQAASCKDGCFLIACCDRICGVFNILSYG
jgi:hypothetical protein